MSVFLLKPLSFSIAVFFLFSSLFLIVPSWPGFLLLTSVLHAKLWVGHSERAQKCKEMVFFQRELEGFHLFSNLAHLRLPWTSTSLILITGAGHPPFMFSSDEKSSSVFQGCQLQPAPCGSPSTNLPVSRVVSWPLGTCHTFLSITQGSSKGGSQPYA